MTATVAEDLTAERECPSCGQIWQLKVIRPDRLKAVFKSKCPPCRGIQSARTADSKAFARLAEAAAGADQPQGFRLAACREVDPELWFPPAGRRGSKIGKQAKAICAECPAKAACLQYALDTDQREGIWGGMTARERTELRRARKRLSAS